MSAFGKPLLPAVMALKCVHSQWGGGLTLGKIYSGVMAQSQYGDQYVLVRDDRGDHVEFSAFRFEPLNPARRPLFIHLRPSSDQIAYANRVKAGAA
ncbi:hypothetical protein [Asticcacaulis machinosus]|uniref:Uncharacterized protein n=1 Tax=Asticcacaulis machinosus TaxID=2984211 RepID=A0ABT5HGQ3_9CAUL|nr:hypothetical protein [Asticcacaulis machinosus]MDC7675412.1 hypothetical protein [Asticcacaulis machinosus]